MKCGHCATPIPEDAKFCHACGSQVSDAEGQAAATAEMDEASFVHMEELLRKEVEGEFEIERRLGKGGMAIVYLATEVHLSRQVAIKVLPPELTFGHGVERFKREAKTAAALDHPNIIPIYRVATGGKLFWYAMKFLEGKSLDELLREKERFTLQETINILAQVAEALDYAHDRQVIHRDIKPANVMLDSRDRVTVTDYGIAKALTEGTLTASGSVVGTPYYMSPEQGMGRPVTGAADQYSVAVMAYRMLSGSVPFEGESAVEILHKHCMLPAPPLSTVMGGLPDHVYYSVHKALEKKPENRFSSCRAFVKALKEPSEEMTLGEAATVQVTADEVSRAMAGGPPDQSEFETTPMPSAADISGETVPMAATPTPDAPSPITPATPTPSPSIISGVPREKKSKKWMAFAMLGIISIGGGAGVMWWLGQGDGSATGGEDPGGTEVVQQPSGGEGSEPPGAAIPDSSQPGDTTGTEIEPPVQDPEPVVTPQVRDTTPQQPVRQEPVQPARPTTGGIVLSGVPSGATVRLDGVQRQSPITGLRPANYHVTVQVPDRPPYDVDVRVVAGRNQQVPYIERHYAVLQFNVRPRADIYIDEEFRETHTRFRDTQLVEGEHRIRLVAQGYVTVDTLVTLVPGSEPNRFSFTLREQ